MNNTLKKFLIGFILPVILIFVAWLTNTWLGVLAGAVYVAALAWLSRPIIYSMKGSKAYSQGMTDEAVKWFGKAFATKKASVRTSVSYAYILLKSGELEKADDTMKQILKNNQNSPDLPYIKSIMALVLWKKGKVDKAVEMLEEVIQVYKTTSVYGSLGYLLILKGDLEKALQFNLEAYSYNSSDKIIQDNLGQNYYLLGMYDKANEIYKPLIEKAPRFPEPYYSYSLLLLATGHRDEALDYMKKALDYKFTFLSTISREEIEAKIKEVEAGQ
ncbi:MAG TPA: tetratricopeptide repeat protein [Clostridia bacterium]|nr:tetratricopeptide repeat protein [Clostridia bacterium]